MAIVNELNDDQNGTAAIEAPVMAGNGAVNGTAADDSDLAAKTMTAEEMHARKLTLNGEASLNGVADDVQSFEKAAKYFLAAHREEIALRDLQIEELRAKLFRLQQITPEDSGRPVEVRCDRLKPDDEQQAGEAVDQAENTSHIVVENDGMESSNENTTALAEIVHGECEKVKEEMESTWNVCIKAVESILEEDLPEDYLAKWSPIESPALEEKLPRISAVVNSNSNTAVAKKLRAVVVMAVVAQALEENILTPNYLLEDDDELRYILRSLVDISTKSSLRTLLLAVSEEANRKEAVRGKRVSASLDDISQALETLLPRELLVKLTSALEHQLTNVTLGWESVQRYHDHYEVNATVTRSPWDWKSVALTDEGISLLDVNSSAFVEDEAVLVAFPRVCAIDRSRKPSYTAVFQGIVLQKSQAELKKCEPRQEGMADESSGDTKAGEATLSSEEADAGETAAS